MTIEAQPQRIIPSSENCPFQFSPKELQVISGRIRGLKLSQIALEMGTNKENVARTYSRIARRMTFSDERRGFTLAIIAAVGYGLINTEHLLSPLKGKLSPAEELIMLHICQGEDLQTIIKTTRYSHEVIHSLANSAYRKLDVRNYSMAVARVAAIVRKSGRFDGEWFQEAVARVR